MCGAGMGMISCLTQLRSSLGEVPPGEVWSWIYGSGSGEPDKMES